MNPHNATNLMEESSDSPPGSPRNLPDDLPTSLDDRKSFNAYAGETEIYDAWQGEWLHGDISRRAADKKLSVGSSQYITSPVPAQRIGFGLSLSSPTHDDEETHARLQDSEARLMQMVAARAHHREDGVADEDEDSIATDDKMTVEEKSEVLQRSLNMAASNGDTARIKRLVGGRAKTYVDVNKPDEDGTVPLIYASCFVCRQQTRKTRRIDDDLGSSGSCLDIT